MGLINVTIDRAKAIKRDSTNPFLKENIPISGFLSSGSEWRYIRYLRNLTLEKTFGIETGVPEGNKWLKSVTYMATRAGKDNCFACTKARPALGTVPFPLNPDNDLQGLQCVLKQKQPANCTTLSFLCPARFATFHYSICR
ncbi:hypothetical protein XELAEV_18003509mg [Xenopus laevis]|nr:hypothetical protein XELAEV_18003509mg [Xenopus laevis]